VLEILARRASWRARAVNYLEIGFSLLIFVAVITALVTAPAPATVVAGLIFIAGLVWSSWKRHRLQQVALLVATSDRKALLDNAWRTARAQLRRSRLNMAMLLPGYLLGALTAYSYLHGGLDGFLPTFLDQLSPISGRGIVTWLILGGVMTYLVRTDRRIRHELRNVHELRERYRTEAQLDALSASDA